MDASIIISEQQAITEADAAFCHARNLIVQLGIEAEWPGRDGYGSDTRDIAVARCDVALEKLKSMGADQNSSKHIYGRLLRKREQLISLCLLQEPDWL